LTTVRCCVATVLCALRPMALAILLVHGWLATAAAACDLAGAEPVTVLRLAETGDLFLADGRIITLEGIDWPARDEPARRAALVSALEHLFTAGSVRALFSVGVDRWRRQTAQLAVVVAGDTAWIQGMLLEDGLTFAWSGAAAPRCWPDLLSHEALAREAGRGLWSAPPSPSRITARVIYEGRVRSVRPGRRMTFVNFDSPGGQSPGWMLTQRQMAAFRQAGRDPATFVGKRLRLRAVAEPGEKRRLTAVAPHMVEVLE